MKIKIIIISLITFIISFIISYIYPTIKIKNNIQNQINIILNTPTVQIINLNGEYKEYGAITYLNNKEIKTDINIDLDNINLSKIGTYYVTYNTKYKNLKATTKRVIKVVDIESPNIILKSNTELIILLNEEYQEPGYEVTDNYDEYLNDKVKVTNNIDNTKEGTYEIIYEVTDSSNNTTIAKRTVKVQEPLPIITYEENKDEAITKVNTIDYSTITANYFTSSGFYFEGTTKQNFSSFIVKAINTNTKEETTFNMNLKDSNTYNGIINITSLANGEYKLYINNEELINKMDLITRIVRAKIAGKLLTISYNNIDALAMKIEDFYYQYDILIDPGHGGTDPGTSNSYKQEKELNLKVSLYEKCRYEQHGLSVYLTRNNDSTSFLGNNDWTNLRKRAYTIGYYGAVSKIIYSNHLNSNGKTSTTVMGYEILTPAHYTYSELQSEHDILAKFNNIYNIIENHNRFYARNYDTDAIFTTINGETYKFTDYYAIIRIPYQLFKTKVVIYEGIYMNNLTDYNWYWTNSNWIKVSEAKIETYVKSLGKDYLSDNSACLS